MVILDVGLPLLDGWQVLERIRDISDIPVLLLTARAMEQEKVRALQAGADDYVTKPFGRQELIARVQALLRRSEGTRGQLGDRYADQTLSVDFASREVRVDGAAIPLTPLEFRLLGALVRYQGQVLSNQQLLEQAWDDPFGVGPERVNSWYCDCAGSSDSRIRRPRRSRRCGALVTAMRPADRN